MGLVCILSNNPKEERWKDKTKSPDLFEAEAKKKFFSYVVDERMIPFQVARITELRNLIPKEYDGKKTEILGSLGA